MSWYLSIGTFLTSVELDWVLNGSQGVTKLTETVAPSTISGVGQLYVKSSDHNLYYKNSLGVELQLGSGGGSSIALKTNGFANGSQSILNLVGGTNVILTDNGSGSILINVAGGTGTVTSVASSDGSITVTGATTAVNLAVVKAPILTTARTLWGQSFDGSAIVSGSLTAVGDITGGASNMAITAGTGNSRTLTLKSTTSGGVATAFITGNADQSTTFGGNISGTSAWSITGGAGNMTILSGTGASRTLILQTTTAGSTATTALTLGADQSATFAGTVALGANNLTMTGSLAATGARVTKGWFTDVEITNLPTINGGTLTAALGLAVTAGKTLTVLKTMSLTAADDTGVYTLPTGTKTLVATDVATLSSLSSIGTLTTGTASTGFVIAGVTMTLGSDASYDLYYRGASGVLTRLPNGTTGQVLTATTSAAPSWATTGGGSKLSTAFTVANATTAGYGITIPDSAGNVYQGMLPVFGTDNAIDTNVVQFSGPKPCSYAFDWLDSTHVVIVYNENVSGKTFAVVGAISGAGTVAFGTAVQMTTVANTSPSVAALSASLFVVQYAASGVTTFRLCACTVSGTTITKGTDVTPATATGNGVGGNSVTLFVDATHFITCDGGSNTGFQLVAGSISGTTITAGTAVQVQPAGARAASDTGTFGIALDSTHFIFAGFHINASGVFYLAVTLSGTTITAGTQTNSGANTSNSAPIALKKLDATHFVAMEGGASGALALIVASVSGTTITFGGVKADQLTGTLITGDIAVISATSFVAFSPTASTNFYLQGLACTVSGTTITEGTATIIDNATTGISQFGIAAALINATTGLVNIAYSSGTAVKLASITVATTTVTVKTTTALGSSNAVKYLALYSSQAAGNTYYGLLGANASSVAYFDIFLTPPATYMGVADSAVSANTSLTVDYGGIAACFTGLTIGTVYYLDSITGQYTTTSTNNFRLGVAVSSTQILIASNPAASVAYP